MFLVDNECWPIELWFCGIVVVEVELGGKVGPADRLCEIKIVDGDGGDVDWTQDDTIDLANGNTCS